MITPTLPQQLKVAKKIYPDAKVVNPRDYGYRGMGTKAVLAMEAEYNTGCMCCASNNPYPVWFKDIWNSPETCVKLMEWSSNAGGEIAAAMKNAILQALEFNQSIPEAVFYCALKIIEAEENSTPEKVHPLNDSVDACNE